MAINLVKSGRNLLRSDARSLDDRPPLLDLGPLQATERFRRLLLPRWDFTTGTGEPPTHRWVCQSVDDRGVEFRDNVRSVGLGSQSVCQLETYRGAINMGIFIGPTVRPGNIVW